MASPKSSFNHLWVSQGPPVAVKGCEATKKKVSVGGLISSVHISVDEYNMHIFPSEMEKGGRSGRAACANFSQLC